ncbi:uncharacterized protein LOC111861650 [Cryptotermes secundus]|uniref:uncharacterized protein LOC111861650 n=1 Tax=Cryptotermes secundus TaxID=105785 RepID=UPI000CD7AB09|nr:uncharacterized protein LOC111861650 [Cryptotermes secundus]
MVKSTSRSQTGKSIPSLNKDVSANQSAVRNTVKLNNAKPPYDTVHKNHIHPSNKLLQDHYNKNKLTILHQNIRGIINKVDEFLNSLSLNAPQIICLSEHHLKTDEISEVNFDHYTVGTSYCRQTYSHGGVCVLVHKNIQFNTINPDQFNKEKDLEICALKLNVASNNFTIICIYRSPTGNFSYFLNQLELILNKVHKTSSELILCGDLNINYLNDSSRKDLLDSLLASFNLFSTINFPTRISNNSCTLIDNIYINTHRHEYSVHPVINGLSDHDAQAITLNNISIPVPKHVSTYTRNINNYSISQFTCLLSYENWEDVFLETNVNVIFNNFLNTFLRIFYSCFPVKKSQYSYKQKPWLTTGIRISCANKSQISRNITRNIVEPWLGSLWQQKNFIIINFY